MDDTKVAVAKATSAWGAVGLAKIGIHQWSDAAAMAAFLYSVLLIAEWCWKKWRRRHENH
jgi:hypothetical protein